MDYSLDNSPFFCASHQIILCRHERQEMNVDAHIIVRISLEFILFFELVALFIQIK